MRHSVQDERSISYSNLNWVIFFPSTLSTKALIKLFNSRVKINNATLLKKCVQDEPSPYYRRKKKFDRKVASPKTLDPGESAHY